MLGAASVANAPPDGYTLLIGGNTTHSVVQTTYKKVPYDPVKSFTPIAQAVRLLQRPGHSSDVPAHNSKELIDYLKANPGKLEYGYGNSGGLISGELLRRAAGVEIARVAYRSNPQGLTDLISGHIKMMIVDSTLGVPQIKAGKIRAIAVSTKKRSALLPDVPTFGETFAPGHRSDRLGRCVRSCRPAERRGGNARICARQVRPRSRDEPSAQRRRHAARMGRPSRHAGPSRGRHRALDKTGKGRGNSTRVNMRLRPVIWITRRPLLQANVAATDRNSICSSRQFF